MQLIIAMGLGMLIKKSIPIRNAFKLFTEKTTIDNSH
jgi:hypothetical protein